MQLYTVAKGDTLSAIARRFHTAQGRIESDNAILEPDRLVVGQCLIIRPPEYTYTVQQGDSLWDIAQKNQVSLWALMRENPDVLSREYLYPKETLYLPFRKRAQKIMVNGYAYPYIDLQILRMQLPYLTWLSVFSYDVLPDGTLQMPNDDAVVSLARRYQVAPVMVIRNADENGNFSTASATALLESDQRQNQLITQIANIAEQKGYFGVDVDMEYLGEENSARFSRFVRRLTARMQESGRKVFVALPPKTSATQQGALYEGHDYAALGAAASGALLMTYEWGYTYGPAQAVAPLDKVREVVGYAVTEIPPQKVFLGIPNYGYDFTLPYLPQSSKARSIGNVEAVNLAWRYGAEIAFDSTAQTPFFHYMDTVQQAHTVWFEDARSIAQKLTLVKDYQLAGVGIWQMMRSFPQMNLMLNEMFDIEKVPMLF